MVRTASCPLCLPWPLLRIVPLPTTTFATTLSTPIAHTFQAPAAAKPVSNLESPAADPSYLWLVILAHDRACHENSHVMFTLTKHVICCNEKLDIAHFQACFFKHLALRALGKRLPVFEMPTGTLQSACYASVPSLHLFNSSPTRAV